MQTLTVAGVVTTSIAQCVGDVDYDDGDGDDCSFATLMLMLRVFKVCE